VNWSNGITEWVEGDTAFISVVFSWKLPEAFQRAAWHKAQGYKVRVGGPGTFANKKYLQDVADQGGEVDAMIHHNPNATFSSRGCPGGCYFCVVPAMEGKTFTLLPDFSPRSILCDNNVSALPVEYQEFIIDKYKKSGVVLEDINSGFEPKTFDEDCFNRWKPINKGCWRFAYDETKEEADVYKVTQVLKDIPSGMKRVYVLIGNEPFEECYRRIKQVIEWGCEPHIQPMFALNTLIKKPIIRYDWTEQKLRDLARWSNRWNWRTIKFEDYKRSGVNKFSTAPKHIPM
jgi:hypothetical protein